jgi:HPr kinase/phosphorylase
LGSEFNTTKLIYLVGDFLDDQFAPRISIHGSFVDVYGVGMLFIGKSGIGKSEVALDLIERGHRLVADDIIILTKKGEGILIGFGTNLVKHIMEIRGLGLIDVERMFGIRAIRYQKRLEVIVELEVWSDKEEYTRTGLDGNFVSISDVEIPYVKLPILPGKNITVISEVISLNYLLKHFGYDAAAHFQNRLNKRLNGEDINKIRGIEYFEHDFE